MNIDKLLSNKKLLLLIGAALLIIAIIAIILLLPHPSSSPAEDSGSTDDLEHYQLIGDISEYVYNNHPIDHLLPIRNQSPFYYIALVVDSDDSNNFSASLEISYYTAEGKAAAEARLKSAEFTQYHPENYRIIYTQLTKN